MYPILFTFNLICQVMEDAALKALMSSDELKEYEVCMPLQHLQYVFSTRSGLHAAPVTRTDVAAIGRTAAANPIDHP